MAQMQEKLEKATRDLTEKEEELATAKQDLSKAEKELSAVQSEIIQTKSEITKLQSEKKDLENKLQTEKKDSAYWESKASDLETDIQVSQILSIIIFTYILHFHNHLHHIS